MTGVRASRVFGRGMAVVCPAATSAVRQGFRSFLRAVRMRPMVALMGFWLSYFAASTRPRVGAAVVLLAKGLENGLSLCEKRVTSDEHPDRKRRPKPASARRGNARPFVP